METMESLAQSGPADDKMPSKKVAVLKAALRLFLEQGYGATSMDAIAKAAGVSKATLYAHLKNKEELFAAITTSCAKMNATLHPAFEAGHQDIRAELLSFALDHVALLLSPEGAAMYRIVIAEAPRFPELGRTFFENGPAIRHRALVDYFKTADELGLLKVDDARRAASEFFGMIGGMLHLRAMLGQGHRIVAAEQEAAVEHAVDTFLRAYRAQIIAPMGPLALGTKGRFTMLVGPEHLANNFKDAMLPPVLSTPVMIMVMENAALNALKPYLEPGESAVGTRIDIRHLAATPVGQRVTGEAEVTKISGRRIDFVVRAFDETEEIGNGTHERAIVSLAKIAERLEAKRR